MKRIWEKSTGLPRDCEAVDAREILERSPDIYTDVNPKPASALPPPPPALPPLPIDPLADLPTKWRDLKPAEMRQFAERIGGRTPSGRDEAVTMIEAAIAARK
jgi:hypothetical protein